MNQDGPPLSEHERQELLERLRQTGLRLDREGRWWHEGQIVAHAGLNRALHRWLDRLPDGRYVVRLDTARYAYVEVEDAPFLVRTLVVQPEDRIELLLSDDSREELAYQTVRVGEDQALYSQVHGRFDARFSRQAHYLLAERIAEDGDGFVLRAAGQRWRVGQRAAVRTNRGVF